MKVIYEFDPYEDREELAAFQQALKLKSFVWEYGHNVKFRTQLLEGEKLEGYELAMKHFYEMAEEAGVDLE